MGCLESVRRRILCRRRALQEIGVNEADDSRDPRDACNNWPQRTGDGVER